jgi:hypothetical protein
MIMLIHQNDKSHADDMKWTGGGGIVSTRAAFIAAMYWDQVFVIEFVREQFLIDK